MFEATNYNTTVPGPEPSDDDLKLLALINAQEGGFGTAREIVDGTEVGYKQTRNRLDDLTSKGLLNVRTVGTTKVYWLTDEGESTLSKSRIQS
jgi:predicted transcriptional regulator